jgi:hypothetical protein
MDLVGGVDKIMNNVRRSTNFAHAKGNNPLTKNHSM